MFCDRGETPPATRATGEQAQPAMHGEARRVASHRGKGVRVNRQPRSKLNPRSRQPRSKLNPRCTYSNPKATEEQAHPRCTYLKTKRPRSKLNPRREQPRSVLYLRCEAPGRAQRDRDDVVFAGNRPTAVRDLSRSQLLPTSFTPSAEERAHPRGRNHTVLRTRFEALCVLVALMVPRGVIN